MDRQVLNRILEEYRLRREDNRQLEADRIRRMDEECPDVARIMHARHEFVMMSVRSAFAGGAPEDPEERMRRFNRDVREALQRNGYPPDYLEPVCQCEKCRDTGFVGERKTPCACLLKAYADAVSGDENEAQETFEAYDAARFPDEPLPGTDISQREYMGLVSGKCARFADDYPNGDVKNALLYGASGLGKTYLLHCIANRVRARGIDTLTVTAFQLLAALRQAYFSHDDSAASAFFDAQLLLIDDLGMEPLVEGVTVEQIYNLLNTRMARGRGTVISTNLPLNQLKERYTERVTSRLRDARSCLSVPFLGKDIRLIRP